MVVDVDRALDEAEAKVQAARVALPLDQAVTARVRLADIGSRTWQVSPVLTGRARSVARA